MQPDLALSLVTSLLKSADIDEVLSACCASICRYPSCDSLVHSWVEAWSFHEQAMGDTAAAQAAYEEAERILKDVGSDIAPESAADMKRQALQQFLDARRGVGAIAS